MSDDHGAAGGGKQPAMAFYYHGEWFDTPPNIVGPMDHGLWFGSAVFDGCRSFDGVAPDLDAHCARFIASARIQGMRPPVTAAEVADLCRQAVRRLPADIATYIRPMIWPTGVRMLPGPDDVDWCVAVHEMAMPEPRGFSACLASVRRPARDMAPTTAKAGCLYPNTIRGLRDAAARGFQNAVVLDPNGNVAEFANANLWMVRDGVVRTPAINGTFLNGITRQRVMALLQGDGMEVEEAVITFDQVMEADEVFNSGNMGKVLPCIRLEDRALQPGPVFQRARALYFEWAKGSPVS